MKKFTHSQWELIKLTAWFIFVLFCADILIILFDFVTPLVISGDVRSSIGLSKLKLYQNHPFYYWVMLFFALIIALLKMYMAFVTAKFVSKLNIGNPFFQKQLADIFMKISKIAILLGCITLIARIVNRAIANASIYQESDEVTISSVGQMLLLGMIMYIFAYIFKKGTDLQEENELTI